MTMLDAVAEAEFSLMRDRLEVSDSVMSKHLSALVACGYVKTSKARTGGRRTTWVRITRSGRRALRHHVAALRELIDNV